MRTVVKNAKIVTDNQVLIGCNCAFTDGYIDYVGSDEQIGDVIIDAEGNYLIPGFIDLHCHGGNGFEFMDASIDEIDEIAKFHLAHGTTTMLATTLAAGQETECALKNLQDYVNAKHGMIRGINLEGPWLNPEQCGAQNCLYMRAPDKDELIKLKNDYPSIMRACCAPELEGGLEFGEVGKQLGLVMSCAHTDGTFLDMEKALAHGYNLMTHLYSGMKGVTRKNSFRIAGAVEAGLYFDEYFVELIADVRHLPSELLKFVYKIKGSDKICLITDAIRACGMKEGAQSVIGSKENGIPVVVEDGVAKLLDRQSFAGSTSTYDKIYKTMASVIGKDMVALSKMTALTPAKVMNWQDVGCIAVGKRADMLIVDENLDIKKVITKGA
jgi:N-acetylglucosamine-6-phosphate deacetylase